MKYVVVLADGMADERIEALGGLTPLEYANTPTMKQLAPYSEIGMVYTIPEGCAKGSDTANLSVLGYNPKTYYFGRSPLEALSMGVALKEKDVTFRVNVVTVSEEYAYEDKIMIDHSADEITTEEAMELIETIKEHLGDEIRSFYPGVSYRHLLVWDSGSTAVSLTPPHDILGKRIGDYMPVGEASNYFWNIMKKSYGLLNNHPVNVKRRERGLRPANSIWIWGEGTKPNLPSFYEKYGVEGAVISAVDLIKGIGIGTKMTSIDVEGATGNLHTNYIGKTTAALKWLLEEDKDFVYIHLEGPDECGHRNELENKIKAIEWIDQKVMAPVVEALEEAGVDYKLMVLPDHPTPVRLRTHTGNPVPYMIYTSTQKDIVTKDQVYGESFASTTGHVVQKGSDLMGHFIKRN